MNIQSNFQLHFDKIKVNFAPKIKLLKLQFKTLSITYISLNILQL